MGESPKRRSLTEGYQPKALANAAPDSALRPPVSPSPIKHALRLADEARKQAPPHSKNPDRQSEEK